MSEQRFTLVPGWIDTAGRTRTWRLVDAKGKLRAEMTTKRDAGEVVAALNLAALLVQSCARSGHCIAEHARYQFSDDDPLVD